MKKCFIFAALPTNAASIEVSDGDLIIAADGGYNNILNSGLTPDIILGDFDSLGYVPSSDSQIIKHPAIKDDTDTMLAVKIALEKGYKQLYIYGGLGGRTDHTLANIQTLAYIAENGARGYLITEKECITVIKNSYLEFKENSYGTVSVFSVSNKSEGVTLKGLSYTLNNATLTSSFPLGVSNSFIGVSARIGTENGMLAVIWNPKTAQSQEDFNEKNI